MPLLADWQQPCGVGGSCDVGGNQGDRRQSNDEDKTWSDNGMGVRVSVRMSEQ